MFFTYLEIEILRLLINKQIKNHKYKLSKLNSIKTDIFIQIRRYETWSTYKRMKFTFCSADSTLVMSNAGYSGVPILSLYSLRNRLQWMQWMLYKQIKSLSLLIVSHSSNWDPATWPEVKGSIITWYRQWILVHRKDSYFGKIFLGDKGTGSKLLSYFQYI